VNAVPWANLHVPSGDETRLLADSHVPPESEWPVTAVVTRTPYGRSKHLAEGRGWRRRGYAFVAADVRGRYDSDGVWEPYRNERADGAALVDWILAQPWSDGRVVAYGGSYSGYTAWSMAVERPESIAAVVSLGPSMSLARTKFSPSGVLRLAEHAAWWAERGDARTSRDGFAALFFAEQPEALQALPVVDLDTRLGAKMQSWRDIVLAGPDALNGEEISDDELAGLPMPTLHVGGWHDLLLPETLEHWDTVGERTPGSSKHLLIGPWLHDLPFSTSPRVGDRDYGADALRPWGEELVDWISAALAGRLEPRAAEVFVMGENRWRTAETWPAPTRTRSWTVAGGVLVDDGPGPGDAASEEFSITYRPSDPFPSYPDGVDRSSLAGRPDVLRFETPVLEEPLRIEGAGSVRFSTRSSAEVVDWVARTLEITAADEVFELALGETTLHSHGPVEEAEIKMRPVAVTVPAGSRLVLELTASDFPRLARNLGRRGEGRYMGASGDTIIQSVVISTKSPLLLDLPIIDATEHTEGTSE
jgi:putative CocE/NonD family hydrolase